jgi:hypothetical protein
MDNITLKKKLSTYLTEKGYFKNVTDELLYEVLIAWENWKGPAKEFYQTIGFSYRQMAGLIGRAKRLKREGYFGQGDFREVNIEEDTSTAPIPSIPAHSGAEIIWQDGRVIRFYQVDLLLEFLKKIA